LSLRQIRIRPLVGRFAYLAERDVWTKPPVRQIRPERIWTAEGWPWSAQRGGGSPMDGANNPSRRANVTLIEAPPWGAVCVSRGERRVDEASGSTNSSGTNLDSRRRALEPAARRGEPHG